MKKKWIGLQTEFASGDITLSGTQLIQTTKDVKESFNSIYGLNYAVVPRLIPKDVENLLNIEQLAYFKVVDNIQGSSDKHAKKRELNPSHPKQVTEIMYEKLVEVGLVRAWEVRSEGDFERQFRALAFNPSSPIHQDSMLYPLFVVFGVADNLPPKYYPFVDVDVYNEKIDFARNETLEGAAVQDIGDEQARIVGFVQADLGKMGIVNNHVISNAKDCRGGGALKVIKEKIEENGGVGCHCNDCKDLPPEEVAASAHLLTLHHHKYPRSSEEHKKKYGHSTLPSALPYREVVKQKGDMVAICAEHHADEDMGKLAEVCCSALAGDSVPSRTGTPTSSPKMTRWYLVHQYNMRTNEGNTVIGDMPITLATTHRVAAHHPTQKKPLKIVGLPTNGGEITLQTGKSFQICELIQGSVQCSNLIELVAGDVGKVADARCSGNSGQFMDKSTQEMPCVITSTHTSHDLHHKLENHRAVLDDKLGIERGYTVTDTHYEMKLQDMPHVKALVEKYKGIDNIPRLPSKITFTEEDVEISKKKKRPSKKEKKEKREVIKLKRSSVTKHDISRNDGGRPAITDEDFRALVNHEADMIVEPGSYDPDDAYAEKLAILKGEGPEESKHYVKLTKSLFVPRAVNESASTVGGDELVADESLSTEDDSPDAGESPTIEDGQLKDDYARSKQEATNQALEFMLETAQPRDVNDTTSLKAYGVGVMSDDNRRAVSEQCARREGIDHGEDLSKVGPAKKVSETPANHKEDTNKESPVDIAKPSSAAVSVGKAQFSGLQGTGDDDLPSPPKSDKPTSTMASLDYGEDSVTLPSNPAGESVSKKRKAAILEESNDE